MELAKCETLRLRGSAEGAGSEKKGPCCEIL